MKYKINPNLLNPALSTLLDRADEVIDYTNRNLKEINDFLDEAEKFLERSRNLYFLYESLKKYPPSMN